MEFVKSGAEYIFSYLLVCWKSFLCTQPFVISYINQFIEIMICFLNMMIILCNTITQISSLPHPKTNFFTNINFSWVFFSSQNEWWIFFINVLIADSVIHFNSFDLCLKTNTWKVHKNFFSTYVSRIETRWDLILEFSRHPIPFPYPVTKLYNTLPMAVFFILLKWTYQKISLTLNINVT